ncbi:hypothetical protein HMPREF0063_12727 [Aeromicrobium marinum DSM 15272]|uniref:Uncharacterized protein n=2 Tax=Aeromicrobium marinum TaxID=219314 RepID=E2SFB8_9ACTN|nr:hypothetical protein HMPREF0063_12727 [Aeromicrobium marinum DSM 15272]
MVPHRLRLATRVPAPHRRWARRVGLRGVLGDLHRRATPTDVPGRAAGTGLTWEARDRASTRWYPQGITTSADAYGPDSGGQGTFDDRSVVVTSWYARGFVGRVFLGSRLSVLDVTDPDVRYRHVLLVEPRRLGPVRWLHPVRVHAGGIVWYGDHLFVAGSASGIRVFALDAVERARVPWRGYRYLLPQVTRYVAEHDRGTRPMTYSFMSLDRSGPTDHLVVGEYGRAGGSHRLMRYALDRATHLLAHDEEELARPVEQFERQVPRMQGAAVVDGTWVVTASAGEGNPGDLWVGRPDAFVRHRGVLPTGPEDITWWPQRGELWSLTEWPGRRWVYPVDARRWLTEPKRPDVPTVEE